MTPLSAEKPAAPGTKRPHDDPEGNAGDEYHGNAAELGCLFQIETFRQASTDSIAAHEGMTNVYIVRPAAIWDSMSRFKNFSGKCSCHAFVRAYPDECGPVNNEDFAIHDDIYIDRYFTHFNPARTIERVEWAARVLEIRGFDEAHVYLRVMWFYIPEDLPRGREDYHGAEEFIASNDMSIVDGFCATGHADIPRWTESDDELPKHASPYWRQTYDKITGKLSELPTYCICFDPQNPDEPLIRCTDPECSVRMHQHCIYEEFESDLYRREYRESDAAAFLPNTMFNVKIINVEDQHNYHEHVKPPRLEIIDNRSTPPSVWEEEIVCLQCEEPLA